MTVLVTLFGVVLAVVVVLVAGLLRSHAEIIRSLHGLGVDLDPDSTTASSLSPVASIGHTVPRPRVETRQAADLAGVTPSGDATSVAILGAQHPTLLSFLTSGCTTCADFWSAFSTARLDVPGNARLVVVTKGPEAESPSRLRKFAPPDVLVVMSSDAWEAYDVPVAPYFAYVDGESGLVVGEGAAASWPQLVGMLEQSLADAGIRPGKKRSRRAQAAFASQDRADLVDRDLRSAGIGPGHPSLYAPPAAVVPHDEGS